MPDIRPSRELGKLFFDVQEFSDVTGLSVATVRRYVQRGRLPSAQPGGRRGRILIPISAVALLERNAEPTAAATRLDAAADGEPSNADDPSPERLPGPEPRWARGRGRS